MKIGDKEMRVIAECRYSDPTLLPTQTELARELLTLRAEVRRLRKALRLSASLMGDPLADKWPRSYMLDVKAVVDQALSRRAARKGKGKR